MATSAEAPAFLSPCVFLLPQVTPEHCYLPRTKSRGNIVAPAAMEEIAGGCLDSELSTLQTLGPSRWRRSWDDQSRVRAVEYEGSVKGGNSDPKRGPKRPRMESPFIREMNEAEECETENGENSKHRDGVGMNVSIANWGEETRLRQNKCPRLVIPETPSTGTTAYSASAENNQSSLEADHFRSVGITGEEEFKEMLKKLKKLKWRWGPPVHPLTNDRFIMKSGACLKTAILGKDKFASGEDVMRYVKEVLEHGEHRAREYVGGESQPEGDIADQRVERERSDSQDMAQVPITNPVVEPDSNQVTHDLNCALGALSSSNVTRAMKQRTKEFKEVFDFIYMNVKKRRGGSIYLCGCPGTGKSQTVTNVKNDLLQCAREVSTILYSTCSEFRMGGMMNMSLRPFTLHLNKLMR